MVDGNREGAIREKVGEQRAKRLEKVKKEKLLELFNTMEKVSRR